MNKALLTIGAAVLASGAYAQTSLFDAEGYPAGDYVGWGGSNGSGTVAANINSQGEVFGLAAANQQITGFDMEIWNAEGASAGNSVYNDLRLQVTFYSGFQATFTGSGNEFTTAISTTTFDLGAQTLANNTLYNLNGSGPSTPFFSLPTPVSVTGSNIGIQFTWLADTGNGLGAATTVQTAWEIGATGPSIGSNAFQYANLAWGASGATSSATSIAQSNYWYGGANYPHVDLGVQIYGASPAPEPVSMSLLAVGAVGLIVRRRKQS